MNVWRGNPPASLGAAIAAGGFTMNQLVADKFAETGGEHHLQALPDVGCRLPFTLAPEPGSDGLSARVDATASDRRTGNPVRPFDLELIEPERGEPPTTNLH